ncbi:hypothetical protein PR048_014378 [Dryococelus australis]|uniref:Tigger transposable element-derived protein 4 n=1 Tax=Dryococelus australis TaxID=614101 RepID=A0ABQ9HE23_9NEOP|nr:hypothetical protein PR048_014378 [Dryococelus australis]
MSGKRASLSLMKTYEIIEDVDEQKNPKAEIARQHGIPKSTLFTILKMREVVNEYRRKAAIGPMVQKKADKLTLKFGIDDLKCSIGWLDRFKVCHGISCHKAVDESASVDPKSVSEWLPLLQNVLSHYQPRDIYNADELGMFCNLIRDCTRAVKGDLCKGMKRSKELLTVLLGNILPSDHDFNKKAWMTSAVFTRWPRCFGAKIGAANRKVIFFVDKCPAHLELNLRNIELVFLPKNTSMLQPLDHMVLKMEIGKDMKWDVFRAMEAIVASSMTVQQKTIANCFLHAYFVTQFVTANNNAVWGTLDYTDDVQGQQELSGEGDVESETDKPAQVPRMRVIF